MLFNKGDRVSTPLGPGVVVYRRMKGPEYSEAASYSVKLDSKPFTAGTPFLPYQLTSEALSPSSEESDDGTKESLDDSR